MTSTRRRRPLTFLVLIGLSLPRPTVIVGQEPTTDPIAVVNQKSLSADKIQCDRIPLGEPDDYKPCIAHLPNGELLLTSFHQHKKEGGKVLEQTLLFRSKDGGKTWSKPEKLDLLGREPYLTVLKDGTIFVTGHLLANDVRNRHGYTHSYLHRSTDAGKSWESICIESEAIKPKASNHSTRNVLQLADGTLLLGVDYDGGDGPYLMWRSKDNGKTWDKTGKCQPKDFKSKYGFFGGETWLWQAKSGKIWALVRVDSNELPIKDRPLKATNDQADHFILFSSVDDGKTFDRIRDIGDYGEMYMSILRLQDNRLLLTFTVRDLKPPLGVRAIAGVETDDGFEFDFTNDRIMLDTRTPKDKDQGGGFGPTVQLKDGTLVTSYSYRGEDNKTHLEVVRWKLPAMPVEPISFKHARVTDAWAAYEGKLTFGKGQTLALLDDGCKLSMPEWAQSDGEAPKVLVSYDSVDGDNDPKHEGRGYHGSTIGIPSSLNFRGRRGVAFNNQAAVVRAPECCHCNVKDSQTLAAGLQWVIDNHAKYRITAVNLAPVDDLEHDKPVATEIDAKLKRLRELGIWVSAPAGNHNFTNGISWPAWQPNCFAVGAVKPGKDEVYLDRHAKIELVVPAAATSSSNAIVCGSVLLLREAIEKSGYDWKKDGPNLPDAMMVIFQRTGVAV
jgi:BNR repeat-like domain